MKIIQIFTVVFLSLILNMSALAQVWTAGDNITLEISNLALIETNYAPVSLILTTSTAGFAIAPVTNSSLYIKVSSLVPTGTSRKITAKVSSGVVLSGTRLTLVSSACTTTNSGGHLGTHISSPIILSSVDQDLVTDIRSCYTGTGSNDGYKMTFTWGPYNTSTDYSQIVAENSSITVAFTITAADGN